MIKSRIVNYLENHSSAFQELCNNTEIIRQAAAMVIDCFQNGGKVLLCGNGGSAADAQHIAGEFVGRFRINRDPLPAIALHTDTSVMSCIANDYHFDEVFSRAVKALGQEGDLLWAFSTSGSSSNIVKAAKQAKLNKMKVLAFTGKPHSRLDALSDLCYCASTDLTCIAQEMHQIVYHLICELVDEDY